MEKFFEKSEIMSVPVQLFTMSFMREVMADSGIQLDEGIIIIADDMSTAKHFVKTYVAKAGNGKILGRKMQIMENFEVGLKFVTQGMKEEQTEEFLGEEDFLPVLVTGGVLPSYLRTQHFFLRIHESDVKVMDDVNFQAKLQGLKKYIIKNINAFTEQVQLKCNECKPCAGVLKYVEGLLLWCYIRNYKLKEEEIVKMANEFEQYAGKLLKNSEDIVHANGDVREEISNRLFQFVATNQELEMVDISNETGQKVSKDTVIWFDDEYYYLTDAMFRKSCKSALELVSVNELKAILKEEGILYCDTSGDYSIKITVETQNGKQRLRVLKMHKLYLTVDGKYLEDVYQERKDDNNVKICG